VPVGLCAECGAPLPEGGSCRDLFHQLLVLEGGFPGAPGSILHFYAVASYNLQHPESSGLTVDALHGLYRSIADSLDGRRSLAQLRAEVRRSANGSTRVLRREGDPVQAWPVTSWPLNVTHVLVATEPTYGELVTAWARSVREALRAALG
jgi:hypothetical protein